jgi:hypothetical protein
MAAFNFEVFEAEFKQRRLLQDVADLFGALRNPEDPNERLLPVEPGDPLHNFMQKLRIDETPAPDFDFELGNPITVEDAANRCADRRVNDQAAPVNLPDMLVTAVKDSSSTVPCSCLPLMWRSADLRLQTFHQK